MRSMQPMRECPTKAVRKQRVAALANSIQNETEGEARKLPDIKVKSLQME